LQLTALELDMAETDTTHMRQGGTFAISEEVIKENPELVLKVMGQVIVIKCEYDYLSGTFKYTAISPYFEEIAPGMEPPGYGINFDDTTEEITWVKD
jgi:hypothetical protein